MAALVPYHAPPPARFSWSLTAALQLIRERRATHQQFDAARNRSHHALWNAIATNVFAAVGFVVTGAQCRTKWEALKRGYENLDRIIRENPDGFSITSPNTFDEACFQEMSDEFWTSTSNYSFMFGQFIYIIYLYRLFTSLYIF